MDKNHQNLRTAGRSYFLMFAGFFYEQVSRVQTILAPFCIPNEVFFHRKFGKFYLTWGRLVIPLIPMIAIQIFWADRLFQYYTCLYVIVGLYRRLTIQKGRVSPNLFDRGEHWQMWGKKLPDYAVICWIEPMLGLVGFFLPNPLGMWIIAVSGCLWLKTHCDVFLLNYREKKRAMTIIEAEEGLDMGEQNESLQAVSGFVTMHDIKPRPVDLKFAYVNLPDELKALMAAQEEISSEELQVESPSV